MTDIIELAKKCGALELRIGWLLAKEQLQAFEAAIRQDQIEKDAKICKCLASACTEVETHNSVTMMMAYEHAGEAIRRQIRGDYIPGIVFTR